MDFLKVAREPLWRRHQIKIRFLLVGAWNTIFGYLVFVGFDYLFNLFFSPRYVAYMSAAALANILAILNAYIFHKFVTFRSPIRGLAVIPEFARFFLCIYSVFFLASFFFPFLWNYSTLTPK